jgi:c(7)-type cytochrome triheme protein
LLAATGAALIAAPLFAFNAPQDVRIPPLEARAKPVAARFSHWEHSAQQCYACHPTIFPQSLRGFTHDDMQAGRYCASCHEGRTAKAVDAMRCEGCHVAR